MTPTDANLKQKQAVPHGSRGKDSPMPEPSFEVYLPRHERYVREEDALHIDSQRLDQGRRN